jgi:hypothetical protein
MTDGDVSRDWIIQAGEHLYAVVIQYRDGVRHFCMAELGMSWPLHKRDSTYFVEKMREARRRKKERRERMLALIPRRQCWEEPEVLEAEGGEADTFLSTLLAETRDVPAATQIWLQWLAKRPEFDLKDAEEHLLRHVTTEGVDIRALPPLVENPKLDIIFKFVAAIFLRHAGLIHLDQPDPETIFVSRTTIRTATDELALIACA